MDKYFNIRVYALIISDHDEVLVSEEFHYDTYMKKFPGGGLIYGESIIECIKRELKEELNIEVNEVLHFHTSELFVQSAFNSDHQVIGVYYKIGASENLVKKFRDKQSAPSLNGQEVFSWLPVKNLICEDFTFPNDKEVVRKLINDKKFS